MREKKNILTYEGLRKYEDELHELKVVKRQEVAQKIKEAREQGDLSENAEYDAAKEAQGMLEMKIAKLKELIASARIIDDSKLNTDEVQLLNKVTIRNTANGMTMEYTIVADSEANLKEKKIGSSTPIAQEVFMPILQQMNIKLAKMPRTYRNVLAFLQGEEYNMR